MRSMPRFMNTTMLKCEMKADAEGRKALARFETPAYKGTSMETSSVISSSNSAEKMSCF